MNYGFNAGTKKSRYLQLYEQIKADIVGGYYEYGKKIPSKRTMCEKAQVSVITVEHAYGLLCEEGYIKSAERSGYTVIYKKEDFICSDKALQQAGLPSPRTSTDGHFTFPFGLFAQKIRKVLSERGEEILAKTENKGHIDLRSAITAYLARSIGIITRPEQIIIGSGAEYLYGLIAGLLGKGRTFALENPSYSKIKKVYESYGVQCDMLDMAADGISSEHLSRTTATVLHVTPFKSYPSGVFASASKRKEYLTWAQERKGYIIEDNYDSELTVSKKFDDTLFSQAEGSVIYLNTFSRTVAPSLRIGYMVLPENLLPLFDEKLGFYSCTVPALEQFLLTELISAGDFERNVNRIRRAKRKSK